jgi:hypothetical protein
MQIARYFVGAVTIGVSTLSTMISPLTSDAFWGGFRAVAIWQNSGFESFLRVIFEYFYAWQRPQLGGLANYLNWGVSGHLAQLVGVSWSGMLWLTNLVLILITLIYISKLAEGLTRPNFSASHLFLVFSIGFAVFFSTNALVYHDPYSMNTAASLCLLLPIISYLHLLQFEWLKSKLHLFMAIFIAIISINASEANYPGVLIILGLIILSIMRNIQLFNYSHFASLGGLLVFVLLNIAYWVTANLKGNPSKYAGTQSNLDLISVFKTFLVQIFTSLPILSGLIQSKNSHEFYLSISGESNPVSPISLIMLTVLLLLLTTLILLSLRQFRNLHKTFSKKEQTETFSRQKFIIIGILSLLPMIVIAIGSKYQVELISEFTYYVGAPVFCISIVILSLFCFKNIKFLTSGFVVFLIVAISGFQLVKNLESANTISAKFAYLKVVQLAITDPDSISLSTFCSSKDEVVRRDYAGLGSTTGNDLEIAYFRQSSSIKACPK